MPFVIVRDDSGSAKWAWVGGVTGGDAHDHYGGDGAQIDYNHLANLPSGIDPVFSDVTGSRVVGTVYQNTEATMKIVQISVTLSA